MSPLYLAVCTDGPATTLFLAQISLVLALACIGKIGGAYLGKSPRESLVVGFGLNARGAMGMVLTTIALEYKWIDQRIFVALIVMALATSMLGAVGIKHLLGRRPVGLNQKTVSPP